MRPGIIFLIRSREFDRGQFWTASVGTITICSDWKGPFSSKQPELSFTYFIPIKIEAVSSYLANARLIRPLWHSITKSLDW